MPLLSILIFLPLAGAILLFLFPARAAWRLSSAGAAAATAVGAAALVISLLVAARFDWQSGSLQLEERTPWVPSLGASYHVGVDGISLPLVLLTTFLTLLVLVYSWRQQERMREFIALFLVMETGLLGVFTTLDLLLFYLFWEVALVPMYFIIGVWGHERRTQAALKFFLYTRVGALALLLSILALYLGTSPRSFDLPDVIAARSYVGTGLGASLVLLGFFIGFAIKLPLVPFHSWLPDAHTEAPTAGSVVLAGLLLKMGGYGFLRLALPTVPDALSAWSAPLAALAVVSAIYGAAVAMAQTDLKRLIAITSVNHMGYVMLGIAVSAALWATPADRATAATGATYQMVAHGITTGALFFLVGMLSDRTGTREIRRLSGLWGVLPLFGSILAFAVFASIGLPALVHFAAEVQIVLGTLGVYPWAAGGMLLAILVTTAMFLWMLQRVLLGTVRPEWQKLTGLTGLDLAVLIPMVALILILGVVPGPLTGMIEAAMTHGPIAPLLIGR